MADLASVTEGLIEKVQIGTNGVAHSIAATAYGECNTPAATQVKVVNMTGFKLEKGVTIHVKFINNNTASAAPLLNVNGTGAKNIKLYGTTDAGTVDETTGWQAGAIISFTYDGTYWIRELGYNTNTTYEVKDTYSGTDGNPISGKGVKAALETLDVSNITANLGVDKTITALSETNGKIAATASSILIAESLVTNLTIDLGNKMPKSGGQFTGDVSFASGKKLTVNTPSSDSEAATKKYVDDKTALLTGAMHFKGTTTTTMLDGLTTATVVINGSNYTPSSGDVVLSGTHQEYVWTETNTTTHAGYWELLGDEGSYALKTSTDSAIKTLGFNAGSLPTLGDAFNIGSASGWNAGTVPTLGDNFSVPNVTSVGSVTEASVTNGTLLITIGSTPALGNAFSIPNITSVGTAPTLTVTSKTIPNVTGVGTLPSVNPTSIDVVVP